MMNFLRNRTALIVLIGGGSLVLLWALFSGDQSSSQQVASGPSEDFQIQMAALNNQSQQANNELAATLAIEQMRAGAQVALQTQAVQGELALADLNAGVRQDELSVSLAALNAQLDAQQYESTLNADIQRRSIEAQSQQVIASIQSNTDMFAMQTQAGIEQARMSNELVAFQTAAQTQMFQTQLEAGVIEEQFERDIALAEIRSNEVLQLDYQEKAYVTERRRQKSENKNSWIGGIAKGIGSLFSDINTKENIKQIGETPKGIPLYRFNYKGNPQEMFGVMAQELMQYNPSLVIHNPGALMVDYRGLS